MTVNPVRIAMRAYLSSHHLWAAQHFARMAGTIEPPAAPPDGRLDIRHRSYVIGAVVESVAFAEAFINELLQDAADAHPSYVGSISATARSAWASLWAETNDGSISMLVKYQLALVATGAAPFERRVQPYQDMALVTKVRNLLTHFRPETLIAGEAMRIEEQLRGRFAINQLMRNVGNPFFPDKCLGAGCANWAVMTSTALADEFCSRLSLRPNYQMVQWDEAP